MTWTYKQSTGELFHNGSFIERGYSGALNNKNNQIVSKLKEWDHFHAALTVLV